LTAVRSGVVTAGSATVDKDDEQNTKHDLAWFSSTISQDTRAYNTALETKRGTGDPQFFHF